MDEHQGFDVTNSRYENVEFYEYKNFIKFFHKWIVKPISFWGSSLILRKTILDGVGDTTNKTIIDVSCGDDEIILELAKKSKKVVANDISEIAMAPLIQKAKNIKNVQFKIQNLINLTGNYDIVICKNTSHHMNSISQIEKLLLILRKLGKKIIIMDIEDPRKGILSLIWNTYYRLALRDQGRFFINFEQFIQIIRIVFLSSKIYFKKVNTIKGTYMLAIIDNDFNSTKEN